MVIEKNIENILEIAHRRVKKPRDWNMGLMYHIWSKSQWFVIFIFFLFFIFYFFFAVMRCTCHFK